MRRTITADESAVSESIGFVLIFSLVIVGISLVSLYGYPVLLKQQANADQQIMEKNMIVLQNDLKSLVYKTVPYKETSLKVGGGTMYVCQTSQSFSIDYGGGPVIDTYPLAGSMGEIRYVSKDEGQVVAIENGAVMYRLPEYAVTGSTMLAEPRWFYDEPTRTAVIYMINVSSAEPLSLSGVGTVQMELVNTSYQVFTRDPSMADPPFYVKYTPNADPDADDDFSAAWKNYITNLEPKGEWMELPADSGRYRLPLSTRILVVKAYDVVVHNL